MSDKIKLSDPAKSRMLAWVNALRSDEYTQCRNMLEFREFENSPADNCCLGVLCRVAMADGLKLDTQQVPGSNVNISGYATRFDENTSSAPIAVLGWLLDHELRAAGVVLRWGVASERRPLEDIARPLAYRD